MKIKNRRKLKRTGKQYLKKDFRLRFGSLEFGATS